jgi:hypothetical protein
MDGLVRNTEQLRIANAAAVGAPEAADGDAVFRREGDKSGEGYPRRGSDRRRRRAA